MEMIELNCVGMKHPQAINQVSMLAKRKPGSTIKIVTDDMIFENEIKHWIENSNSNLIRLEKDGKTIKVQIEFE
jgi:TusA-related sulfurtransferase